MLALDDDLRVRNAAQSTEEVVDPRVARSRAAVLRAATDLLVDGGPSAVTIDAIVARSGVAKTTIYRHWESRDDVLLAVLESCAPSLDEPDPDLDVVEGLYAVGKQMAGTLNDPEWQRIFPALLMLANHEDGAAALEQQMERKQGDVLGGLLTRGVSQGILLEDAADPEALAQLVGPIVFAQLTGSVPLDDPFIERTIDRFLTVYRAPTKTKRTR